MAKRRGCPQRKRAMLVDRYPTEDVFARVPELADQTDPVLVQLDHLHDDDRLYQQVRSDLAHSSRLFGTMTADLLALNDGINAQ